MLRSWPLPLAVALLLVVPASAADHSVVTTSNNTFSPDEVTVALGDTVTWTNPTGGFHSVKFDDGSFEMPSSGSATWPTVQRTFNEPGFFKYHCEVHGSPGGGGMSGQVIVLDENGQVPPLEFVSPELTISGSRDQDLKKVLKKGLRIKTRCGNGCDMTFEATLEPKMAKRLGFAERMTTIGKAEATSEPGETVATDVKLTRKAKKKIEKANRKFKAFLSVSAKKDTTESAGHAITVKP